MALRLSKIFRYKILLIHANLETFRYLIHERNVETDFAKANYLKNSSIHSSSPDFQGKPKTRLSMNSYETELY